MSLGPVEYVLIGFEGNNFTGGIAPAIAELVENGTVRIIDLVFVQKDADGSIRTFEYDELTETAAYAEIDGEADGFLADDDIVELASELDPDTAALLIVWEDLWATKLAQEIMASGGQLIAGRRIPHQVVAEVMAEIERSAS